MGERGEGRGERGEGRGLLYKKKVGDARRLAVIGCESRTICHFECTGASFGGFIYIS